MIGITKLPFKAAILFDTTANKLGELPSTAYFQELGVAVFSIISNYLIYIF